MELRNATPLPANAFRQYDAEGDLDCVVAIRGTFVHRQGETLALARDQEPFQWEDVYEGDPDARCLLRQTDLTPGKPGTDVTFLGQAHPPDGRASPSWTCGLAVGPIEKQLRVHGPRRWHTTTRDRWAGWRADAPRREVTGWKLDEAEPVASVPMAWQHAYGGTIPGTGNPETGEPADVDQRNPVGCGILDPECADPDRSVPAPSIETDQDEPRELALAELRQGVDDRIIPAGLGPIAPWWRPRSDHVGTYDEAWRAERHPLLPRDFDTRHWQCAPSDQIAVPHLRGDEDYRLENLHPELPAAEGRLPGVLLGVRIQGMEGGDRPERDEWIVCDLDGVQFDWREPVNGEWRVLLTWRACFSLPEAHGAVLTLNRIAFATEAATDSTYVEAAE